MGRIISYIKSGKGYGMLFLLASAILVTICLMVSFKSFIYTDFQNKFMLIADDILPITVKEGKIVEPANEYKKLELNFGKEKGKSVPFSVVLDTQNKYENVSFGDEGLFITSDAVYLVGDKKVERYSLKDGVWNKEKVLELINTGVGYASAFVSIIIILMYFLMYLFETYCVAIVGKISLKVMKKEELWEFDSLMRLGAVWVSVIELLVFVVGWYAHASLRWWQVFIVILSLVISFLYMEKIDNDVEKDSV